MVKIDKISYVFEEKKNQDYQEKEEEEEEELHEWYCSINGEIL